MAYNPKQILLAMQALYPGLQNRVDYELADLGEGAGPFVSAWHRDDIQQPTMAQIEAVDTDALLGATEVPGMISDRQFFQQLAVQNVITPAEALDAVKTGAIPTALQALIDQMPEGQRFAAEMLVSGATTFMRDHPMTIAIGNAYGWTSGQVDALFVAAALL